MSYGIVLCTVPNKDEGLKIARGLVTKKLAACTNIIESLTSVYFWQGKVCEDSECLLVIKTKKILFDQLKDFIIKNHSYTLPEIIMLPVENGHDAYLKWIAENTI